MNTTLEEENAAFEAWQRKQPGFVGLSQAALFLVFERIPGLHNQIAYYNTRVNDTWVGWLARSGVTADL